MFRTILALAVGAAFSSSCARGVTYGELPPGTSTINENKEVSAEICGDYVFDPTALSIRLPVGYRLISATEYAKQDTTVRELIESEPRFAHHAVGMLCFVALSSFIIDDVLVHQPGVAEMAFQWAWTEGRRDPQMRGTAAWVQLASWYGQDFTDRTRITKYDPMAQFTDVEMTQAEPDLWRLRLTLPNESVEAEVRLRGERTKRNASEPGFTSVVLSGDSARHFFVFTYFGHHDRAAEGTWQARGTDFFSRTLETSPVFNTLFEDGWQGLSGLYQFQNSSH